LPLVKIGQWLGGSRSPAINGSTQGSLRFVAGTLRPCPHAAGQRNPLPNSPKTNTLCFKKV
jgi:hypothetical protein